MLTLAAICLTASFIIIKEPSHTSADGLAHTLSGRTKYRAWIHRDIHLPFTLDLLRVRFSPDGKTVAISGESHDRQFLVSLWSIQNRKRIWQVKVPYFVESITFSQDGRKVIARPEGLDTNSQEWYWGTLRNDKQAPKEWYTASGKEVQDDARLLRYNGRDILSSDKQFCAVIDAIPARNGKRSRPVIKILNARSGHLVRTLTGIDGDSCLSVDNVTFSPDGKLVACLVDFTAGEGPNEFALVVWDMRTGRMLFHKADATDETLNDAPAFHFAPSGEWLLCGNNRMDFGHSRWRFRSLLPHLPPDPPGERNEGIERRRRDAFGFFSNTDSSLVLVLRSFITDGPMQECPCALELWEVKAGKSRRIWSQATNDGTTILDYCAMTHSFAFEEHGYLLIRQF